MTKKVDCTIEVSKDGRDIFVLIDGVRIAKRGHRGTPQAKTWVSLEPGWSVIDVEDGQEIEVSHEGVRVH